MSECSLEDYAAQLWQSLETERRQGPLSGFFQSDALAPIPIESPSTVEEDQEIPQEKKTLSRNQLKGIRVPPPRLLAEWLEENDEGHIVVISHHSDRNKVGVSDFLSLQNILLEYLRKDHSIYSPEEFYDQSLPTLQRLGYTFDDLQKWSTILGVSSQTRKAGWSVVSPRSLAPTRYLESEDETPIFILLIILRFNQISRWNVRALLLHTWYRFLGYSQKDIVPMISKERAVSMGANKTIFFPEEWHMQPWKIPLSETPAFLQLEENAFMVLISRFLAQARRALPTALPSIACMFGHYLWFTRGTLETRSDGSANMVDIKTHARLSKLFNQAINKLSIPTDAYPARDMKHAWQAQKVLIEQAGRYSPPLLLDQDSYRAIVRVLSAFKKSSTELKFARNTASTWPPWREEQDGVDAERPLENDLSRPVLASRRMLEAGFHLDYLDWEMVITGGRDSDGTPTISQRHISNRRSGKKYGEHQLWVARIRATRSAREAWMAFLKFNEQNGPIKLPIYYAIFEKLVYERLRLVRRQVSEALPGESKEVIQHPFQSASPQELARTEPMEEDLLYDHMINSRVIPHGRFLDFLVRTAPSVATGIKYLQDADLHRNGLAMMLNYAAFETKDPNMMKNKIPYSTSDAFIRLLCRFTYGHSYTEKDDLPSQLHRKSEPPNLAGVQKFITPLHYAIQLVRFYKPTFEPTWYSLFRALARPRVVIAAPFSGHPQDDLLSWVVLKQVLADFHHCNLELGLTGFHSICFCFEKAVSASWTSSDKYTPLPPHMLESVSDNWKEEDLEMIKAEWGRMTESVAMPFITPRLLHSFYHAGIHAYIRVLGIARDWEEILSLLKWMVEHKEELDEAAKEYANGKRMRRRVIVAMRYFIDGALADLELERDTEESASQEQSFTHEEVSADSEEDDDVAGGQLPLDDGHSNAILGKAELESDANQEELDSTEDMFSNETETPTETQEYLHKVKLQLIMLLEQEDLEHWGGWPLDVEVTRYAKITRDE